MDGFGWIAIGMFACGEPGTLRSQKTTPTVSFEEDKAEEVVWTDLAGVFPKGAASLPAPLQALRPGMDGAAAREVLMAAHEPGIKVFAQVMGNHFVVSSMLKGTTRLGVTLLMDPEGEHLQIIDLSMPDDAAIPLLIESWGDPTETLTTEGALQHYVWRVIDAPWVATLMPDPEKKKAIVEFTPAK